MVLQWTGLDVSLVSSLSPLIIGLSMTLGFLTYWLTPVSNLFSRKHEFEADDFAKKAVGGAEPLISALRKLYVENLSHPLPHPVDGQVFTIPIRPYSRGKGRCGN